MDTLLCGHPSLRSRQATVGWRRVRWSGNVWSKADSGRARNIESSGKSVVRAECIDVLEVSRVIHRTVLEHTVKPAGRTGSRHSVRRSDTYVHTNHPLHPCVPGAAHRLRGGADESEVSGYVEPSQGGAARDGG